MKVASFESIVKALNEAGVRYLVVGGVAVNAYGYLRFTKDVDLVIRLSLEDIRKAFAALKSIDYHPKVPVTAEEFADPEKRKAWKEEKGMLVLQMWSDIHHETPLDIFTYEPFDFEKEYRDAYFPEDDQTRVRFPSIAALIEMKRVAGRSQDLIDIEKLEKIQRIRNENTN